MKTMLLVAKEKSVGDLYHAELDPIFRKYVNIIPYVHADDGEEFAMNSGVEQADLVVMTNPYSYARARRRAKEGAKIINLGFAFSKERVEQLKHYPVGTEAVACFNYYSSAHQAVNVLYEAGVSNLNLYIHYPGNLNMVGKQMQLAVISGKTVDIPSNVTKLFDLGPRKVALATLLDIAVKANVLDDDLERNILSYCDTICTPDDYLAYFYDNSAASAMQLKAMTECIDYSVFILDHTYHVLSLNRNARSFFRLGSDAVGKSIGELPWDPKLGQFIRDSAPCRNRLFELSRPERSILVSKEKLNKGDDRRDLFMLLLKDVTEISALENSLRRQIAKRGHVARYTFDGIKGDSSVMRQCVEKARRIAGIDKPTLIIGESGTGKELFAQSIHNTSARSKFPFVAMNCAAIPSNLLESELFGYEEGAFTGARKGGKDGLFQMAQKGSLFLDEIGELSLPTQAKLLRVLEEKEIMKVGSGEVIAVDVRIVAATHRNLGALVDSGEFRLDLYYRLNTLTINIPPLRERKSDIPTLIDGFLQQEGKQVHFTANIWDFLLTYQWKGNVRELRNCVEYMANISDGVVTEEHLPDYVRQSWEDGQKARVRFRGSTDLLSDTERGDLIGILALLKKHPAGRQALLQALTESGICLSEYRLRGLLEYLKQNSYLVSARGRGGCRLTQAGVDFLEGLLQR